MQCDGIRMLFVTSACRHALVATGCYAVHVHAGNGAFAASVLFPVALRER